MDLDKTAQQARSRPRAHCGVSCVYGAIGAQIAMPPFLVISLATKPIRWILRSRCSLEKPSSLERFLRTISPSSSVILPAADLHELGHQGVGDGRLARAREAREEHREALLVARRMRAPQFGHHVSGKENQSGYLEAFLQTTPQLGARDVQDLVLIGGLVDRDVLRLVLRITPSCGTAPSRCPAPVRAR